MHEQAVNSVFRLRGNLAAAEQKEAAAATALAEALAARRAATAALAKAEGIGPEDDKSKQDGKLFSI
eukprot:2711998-Pyramimonas_sp.AAC.1